jgi:hypothetical protein
MARLGRQRQAKAPHTFQLENLRLPQLVTQNLKCLEDTVFDMNPALVAHYTLI